MKISIIALQFFLSTFISAQNYKNVEAYQDGLSITVKYDMSGELYRGDQVALTFSIDGGKSYSFIRDAEGDIGSKVLPGKNNEINWFTGKARIKGDIWLKRVDGRKGKDPKIEILAKGNCEKQKKKF